jgi:predicted permease
MDKNELIKIAVTAVITVCARELVGFIIKRSKTAANTFKKIAVLILNKKHWMLIPVVIDSMILFFLFSVFISPFLFDHTPATKQFVVFCAFGTASAIDIINHLRRDISGYVRDLREPSA